ncbi:hypothetical protein DFH94DRAFT_699841 [Russula ochroleuca]|uniref:Uncharacterized protein n=1 Tax=Russula ochroleuca TaxID=152965 RepID=A0A9P5JTH3_9AGAM|nr:hypothetical protein DFH94DRAFT_858220 [Russula ochroleuca]KAF8462207.1 hypothetical protein DFH94DRAFT_699841 [Russula ochroleuca]
MDHPSTYFHPNTLLRWLSFMPLLEALVINFIFPDGHVESHTPTMTSVALPNLHRFRFQGVGTYLEELVHRITAPRLEKLEIEFFNQPTFSVPRFLQFMNTREPHVLEVETGLAS